MSTIATKTKTAILEAVKLPEKENIPAEKQHAMAGSVIFGIMLAGVGFILMLLGVGVLLWRILHGDPGVVILIALGTVAAAGLALIFVGGNIASNQVVSAGILSLKEPLQMLLRFKQGWKNAGESAAP